MADRWQPYRRVVEDTVWVIEAMRDGEGDGEIGDLAEREGWQGVYHWGVDGWSVGNSPFVLVFIRDPQPGTAGPFEAVQWCEGDVSQLAFQTLALRTEYLDDLVFFHWKANRRPWVSAYREVSELPPEMRGPFSVSRMNAYYHENAGPHESPNET